MERGRFKWPMECDGSVSIPLGQEELTLLLGEIDLTQTKARNWYRKAVFESEKIEKEAGNWHSIFASYYRRLSTASKLLAEQCQLVLEEIKPALSEAVFERLNESIGRHQELLERLQRENRLLRELRRLELLEKYGPSAETLSDEQLELLELEPGVSSSEVEAESQRAQLRLPLKSAPARKHPGRQPTASRAAQGRTNHCLQSRSVCLR